MKPILIPEYSLFSFLRRPRLLPIIIAGFTQCTRLRILFPVYNHVFLTSSTVQWCTCTTAGHIEMQFVYVALYTNSSTLSWNNKNNGEFEYGWRWNRFFLSFGKHSRPGIPASLFCHLPCRSLEQKKMRNMKRCVLLNANSKYVSHCLSLPSVPQNNGLRANVFLVMKNHKDCVTNEIKMGFVLLLLLGAARAA